MRRLLIAAAALTLMSVGASNFPQSASAATWDVARGSFSVDDGYGATLAVTVQNLRVSDTGSASGYVVVAWDRYVCTSQLFRGTSATFFPGSFDPCSGTISFAVDRSTGQVSASAALTMTSRLFTGAASGSAQGIAQKPVVHPLQNCAAAADLSARQINVTWTDDPDAMRYAIAVNGMPSAALPSASGSGATVPFSLLTPGTSYSVTITATNASGDVVATCTTNDVAVPWATPGTPTIVGVPIPVAGGQVTVNYDVSDPLTVQRIEYQIDGGTWLRPGGVPPTGGKGGTFTVDNLSVGRHAIVLRSVGFDPKPMSTESSASSFVIPAPMKQPSGPRPAQGLPAVAVGSTPQAPVPVPPAQPASSLPGTSNGAGTGTSGALAANTGDAGIDAPCLAPDGVLYPTLYSNVGSQLTMAPNTHGMGRARSFTVVGGALPAGMHLDREYGVLHGVPTTPGAWTTTIRARFDDGTIKDGQFSTRVDADPQTLQYAAQNIGSVGVGVSIAPSTNAPSTGTTYALVCGTLPRGTRLDPSSGRILGTPTTVVSGPIPLRVAETSSTGRAAASFIFIVDKTGTHHLSYPSHPHARPGKRVTIRPTVSGAGDIVEYRTWLGKLPAGLRLNHATGVFSGRVKHAGRTHTITLVAQTKGGALLTAAPMRLSLSRPR